MQDALSDRVCMSNQFQVVLKEPHDRKKNLRICIWTDNEMVAGCGVKCKPSNDPDCKMKVYPNMESLHVLNK